MVRAALGESIVGRALEKGLLTVECIDIRAYSQNKHKNTDDYPFGGGAGMVMLAQPIVDACEANACLLYTSPHRHGGGGAAGHGL